MITNKTLELILEISEDANSALIKMLSEQAEFLKEQVEREKRRADIAVDRLLFKESKQAAISPEVNPPAPIQREFPIKEIDDRMRMEIETIGEDFGEEDPVTVTEVSK